MADRSPSFVIAGLDIVAATRDVARQVLRDDVIGLGAELAYRFFLALFPFAIFLTALGSFAASSLPVEDPTQRVIEVLRSFMPDEAASLIGGQIREIIQRRDVGLLSASALFALFFATGGTNAIIKAMNRAYDVAEGRPIWRRYIVAIALTLVAGTSIIAAFALYLPIQLLGEEVGQALGLGEAATLALNVVTMLGAFVLLLVGVGILYRVAPNIRLPVRSIVPGAVVFGVGWLAATWGFGFYVANFGSYTATYGALAGVAIVLIWFYVTALILLVGAEVNDVIHEHRDPADIEARRQASARHSGEQRRSAGVERGPEPEGRRSD